MTLLLFFVIKKFKKQKVYYDVVGHMIAIYYNDSTTLFSIDKVAMETNTSRRIVKDVFSLVKKRGVPSLLCKNNGFKLTYREVVELEKILYLYHSYRFQLAPFIMSVIAYILSSFALLVEDNWPLFMRLILVFIVTFLFCWYIKKFSNNNVL